MSVKAKIRTYLARRFESPEIPFALERLARNGFKPDCIFDVGAYRGDFARFCLGIWPAATIACFEPLPDKVKELEELTSTNPKVRVFPGLLGAQPQEAVYLHECETASSVLTENVNKDIPAQQYPMRTVDQIVEEHFAGRFPEFLKLDVQGYELEVLKGAERSLPRMKALLAEVNLLDIHEGAPLFAEFVAWLNERGWVAYDICGLTRRPLDRGLWQTDMLFVPVDSNLRSDKRWSA